MTFSIKTPIKILMLSLFLIGSFTSTAKVYKWVDANGVTQFSQAPPPTRAGKAAPKVKIVSRQSTKAPVNREGKICSILDASRFNNDQLLLLGHLRKNINSWTKKLNKSKDRYDYQIGRSTTKSGLRSYKKKFEQYKCLVKWSNKKIAEMEPDRLQYIKDYQEASEHFELMKKEDPASSFFYEVRNKYKKLHRKRKGLIEPLEDL